MIQDIFPHKLKNKYSPAKKATGSDQCFCFSGNELMIRKSEGAVALPTIDEVQCDSDPVYLLNLDGTDYYGIRHFTPDPDRFQWITIRELRQSVSCPKEFKYLSITAYQLMNWYKDNRYCGTCGSATALSETERAIVCPACNRVIYPRIVPAVIVGVTKGDEILLTKYKGRDIPYYALIAGFTEIGETLEETVQREVLEEAGLRVKHITYYKSQPWGIVDDILAGFFCEVDGSTEIRIDENELKLAQWTKREDIILQPDDFSLTNEMMSIFKDGYDPYK